VNRNQEFAVIVLSTIIKMEDSLGYLFFILIRELTPKS
jgi:hypothetical protein